jgi:hypothetical protein
VVAGAELSVSREAEFLLAAVRRFAHPETPPPDPVGLNWPHLLNLAAAHAVTPALHRGLRDLALPDQVAVRLRTTFEHDARASLALGAELVRLADAFDRSEVAFIPLKGPLLSQRLHGDLSVRVSGDLDFLVHPRDALRARDVLIGAAYALKGALHWPSDSALLRCRDCELSFTNRSRGMHVDLHWRVVPAYFASPFDAADPWQSLVLSAFAGREFRDLSAEHLLLMLCTHGAKHAFERLGWVCDIACCLSAMPDLDGPRLLAISARAGTTRQLLTGVRVAADLLGAPLSWTLPDDPAVEPLVRLVRERLLSGTPPPTPIFELVRFCLRVLESRRHRLRFLAGHLLEPSQAEYQALQLPPALYFLYYPFRPLRLVAKHAFHR